MTDDDFPPLKPINIRDYIAGMDKDRRRARTQHFRDMTHNVDYHRGFMMCKRIIISHLIDKAIECRSKPHLEGNERYRKNAMILESHTKNMVDMIESGAWLCDHKNDTAPCKSCDRMTCIDCCDLSGDCVACMLHYNTAPYESDETR